MAIIRCNGAAINIYAHIGLCVCVYVWSWKVCHKANESKQDATRQMMHRKKLLNYNKNKKKKDKIEVEKREGKSLKNLLRCIAVNKLQENALRWRHSQVCS